jgi:exosome complex RNA-binding protein Csl4
MVVNGLLKNICQISLGDARSYYISTARNDLGVIFGTSEAGKKFWLFWFRHM